MITILISLIVVLGVIPMVYSFYVALRVFNISFYAWEDEKYRTEKTTVWHYFKRLFSYRTFWEVIKDDIRYGDFGGLLIISFFPLWGYPLTIIMSILVCIVIYVIVRVNMILNRD